MIHIRISDDEKEENFVANWSEELGCFVGARTTPPELKRTGATLGELIDALSELPHPADAVEFSFSDPP